MSGALDTFAVDARAALPEVARVQPLVRRGAAALARAKSQPRLEPQFVVCGEAAKAPDSGIARVVLGAGVFVESEARPGDVRVALSRDANALRLVPRGGNGELACVTGKVDLASVTAVEDALKRPPPGGRYAEFAADVHAAFSKFSVALSLERIGAARAKRVLDVAMLLKMEGLLSTTVDGGGELLRRVLATSPGPKLPPGLRCTGKGWLQQAVGLAFKFDDAGDPEVALEPLFALAQTAVPHFLGWVKTEMLPKLAATVVAPPPNCSVDIPARSNSQWKDALAAAAEGAVVDVRPFLSPERPSVCGIAISPRGVASPTAAELERVQLDVDLPSYQDDVNMTLGALVQNTPPNAFREMTGVVGGLVHGGRGGEELLRVVDWEGTVTLLPEAYVRFALEEAFVEREPGPEASVEDVVSLGRPVRFADPSLNASEAEAEAALFGDRVFVGSGGVEKRTWTSTSDSFRGASVQWRIGANSDAHVVLV